MEPKSRCPIGEVAKMKHRLRYSIRDWFLVVAIIAMMICWVQREFENARMMARLKSANSKAAAEQARLERRLQEAADRWKSQVAAVGAELRAIQATKTRNAELEKRLEKVVSEGKALVDHHEAVKAELWFALKKVLTTEQYADFEAARLEYDALPGDVKRFSP